MKLALPTAALLLTGTAAMAELAPQDIIDSWRDYYARMNGTLTTGTPEQNGQVTRFPNVVVQRRVIGGTATYTIGYIDMRSLPDGALDITFSPDISAAATLANTGTMAESHISYDLGTLVLHAEGAPRDMHYSYSAPVVTLQIEQKQSRPKPLDSTVILALEGVQGEVSSTSESNGSMAQTGEIRADALSVNMVFEPQNGQRSDITYRGNAVRFAYDMSMTQWPGTAILFPQDMVFGATITTGSATTTVDQNAPQSKHRFSLTQSGGELTMAFADNALSYGLTVTGAELGLASTPAMPADFTAALERFHLGITLPVRKADTPAPFALALALEGATVGDDIWNRIDPEATLSHAPASFAFSLNGTARLFADLFDQTALTALRGAPFEISSIDLSALSLDFEGLGLTGDGGVTFDNQRTDPASGLPEPTGTLDFSINGALGLLDKLGQLGIGDPMIIIGAKGALGMFATPGDGPDSFTSHIDFTDGGHISINGQQVK